MLCLGCFDAGTKLHDCTRGTSCMSAKGAVPPTRPVRRHDFAIKLNCTEKHAVSCCQDSRDCLLPKVRAALSVLSLQLL